MFIYEKNKLNKETGEVEQSLNVTFEGNKPVETPDVVITKDGVTGIKSDSTAYSFSFYSPDNKIPGEYLTSISIDGEIFSYNPNQDSTGEVSLVFSKSFGYNGGIGDVSHIIIYYINNNMIGSDIITDAEDADIYPGEVGEYVFDMENKIIHTPNKDYHISDLSDNSKTIFEQYKISGFRVV